MLEKKSQSKKVTKKPSKKAGSSAVKKFTAKEKVKKSPTKSSKSSTSSRAVKKKTLLVAPDEKKFWTQNGEIIDSLSNLAQSFTLMDNLVYEHHVNEFKNDFAAWVEQVLEDEACGMDLRRSGNPQAAKVVVVRHLKRYDL